MKKLFSTVAALLTSISALSFQTFAEESEQTIDGQTALKIVEVFIADHDIRCAPYLNPESGYLYITFTSHTVFEANYKPFCDLGREYHFVSFLRFGSPLNDDTSELPTPSYLLGDVTEDGAVGLDDAILTLAAYTEKITDQPTGLSETQTKAADPNGDGALTIEDAMYILKYYTANTIVADEKSWIDIVVFDA